MESKSLLFGLIGFFLGGLIVSFAAADLNNQSSSEMSMSQMTEQLGQKSGSDYDRAFMTYMIEHHQAAIDMAKLSKDRASHKELKGLSQNIITAQEKEIADMKRWQSDWGYTSTEMKGMSH